MNEKLRQKIMANLPKTSLTDTGELELRFLSGTTDLAKFVRNAKAETASGFSDKETILKFVRKFSNFPNMLKKKAALMELFSEPARKSAEIALLSTPYLGVDTAARYYFVPLEFRIYWALMIGIGAGGESALQKLVKQIRAKKLIKNKAEFAETLARIR